MMKYFLIIDGRNWGILYTGHGQIGIDAPSVITLSRGIVNINAAFKFAWKNQGFLGVNISLNGNIPSGKLT